MRLYEPRSDQKLGFCPRPYVNTTQVSKVGGRGCVGRERWSYYRVSQRQVVATTVVALLVASSTSISSNFGLDVAPLDGPGGRSSDGCHHCPAATSCTQQDTCKSMSQQTSVDKLHTAARLLQECKPASSSGSGEAAKATLCAAEIASNSAAEQVLVLVVTSTSFTFAHP